MTQVDICRRFCPPGIDHERLERGQMRRRDQQHVGPVRRECLDRVLIFGEAHLRQILSSYAAYYNEVRTHLALGKDAPAGRAVQRSGAIVAIPILCGLHHHYVRI